MSTSFFGGAFFNGEFFNSDGPTPPEITLPVGGKGDNEKRKKSIFKPTGLTEQKAKPKLVEGRKTIEERIEETRDIAEAVKEVSAQEFAKVAEYQKPIEIMTLSEIDAEIGALMRKKYRDRDDEEMLMLLMLVAQVI